MAALASVHHAMLQPISHSAAKEGRNQREETWGGSKSPKGACTVIFFIVTLRLTGEAFYLEVKWEKCLYCLTFDFICFIFPLVSSFGSTMKFIVDIYIDSVIFKMYSLNINSNNYQKNHHHSVCTLFDNT